MAIIEREKLHELRNAGIDTIPRLFRHRVKVWADNVVMREKDLGLWQEITWAEYGQKARYVAAALLELGLQNGDRVAIISENCPEWLYSDQGILAAGGVTVGIYTTDSAKQVEYVVDNCGAKFYLAEDEEQLDKILEVRERVPSLEKIIVFDMKGLRDFKDDMVISFDDLLEMGQKADEKDPGLYDKHVDSCKAEELAILI